MRKWILGSHNSMTYLRPKTWWGRLFAFVARCQSKTLEEQWQAGVRYFDLRVAYDSDWNLEFRHGAIAYELKYFDKKTKKQKCFDSVDGVLEWLEKKAESTLSAVWVRLILEKERDSRVPGASAEMFRTDCRRWERLFPKLFFHCGRRKSDWSQIYEFRTDELSMEQAVSSMTGSVIDDWCPWLYARLMNRKNLEKGTDKQVLLIDFI